MCQDVDLHILISIMVKRDILYVGKLKVGEMYKKDERKEVKVIQTFHEKRIGSG